MFYNIRHIINDPPLPTYLKGNFNFTPNIPQTFTPMLFIVLELELKTLIYATYFY